MAPVLALESPVAVRRMAPRDWSVFALVVQNAASLSDHCDGRGFAVYRRSLSHGGGPVILQLDLLVTAACSTGGSGMRACPLSAIQRSRLAVGCPSFADLGAEAAAPLAGVEVVRRLRKLSDSVRSGCGQNAHLCYTLRGRGAICSVASSGSAGAADCARPVCCW